MPCICPLPEGDIYHKVGQNMSVPSPEFIVDWNGLEASEHYIQKSMKGTHAEFREISV
jgi:hypothetical protein